MSGGSLNYISNKLQERGQTEADTWALLAVIAHELEWGLSNDTCLDCAYNRCGPALVHFFMNHLESSTAISIMRDKEQHQCERCEKR